MRVCTIAIAIAFLSSGCESPLLEFGQETQGSLLSRPIEQVLQCLGPPDRQKQSGITSTWSYDSAKPSHLGWEGRVAPSGESVPLTSFGAADETQRQCTMNVIMKDGYVSAITYTEPTGNALPPDTRCPFAVMTWCPKVIPQSTGVSAANTTHK